MREVRYVRLEHHRQVYQECESFRFDQDHDQPEVQVLRPRHLQEALWWFVSPLEFRCCGQDVVDSEVGG